MNENIRNLELKLRRKEDRNTVSKRENQKSRERFNLNFDRGNF